MDKSPTVDKVPLVAGVSVVAAMLGVVGGSLWQPLGVLLSALAALGAWVILAVATDQWSRRS